MAEMRTSFLSKQCLQFEHNIMTELTFYAMQVTLLDSLRKRCNFVEKAIQQVGLHNTEVVWGRAEEVGQSQQHREVRACLMFTMFSLCITPVR